MSAAPPTRPIDQLRKLMRSPAEPSDGKLLRHYVERADESAFEAIVRRHGPLVLGVCRRMLGTTPDADDAFQATFLVLVKKATKIAKAESLGSWLHGVAYRVSAKARGLRAKRQMHERRAANMTATSADRESAVRELRPVLDEELARLPEKYRRPLVLCYLEGKSKDEIAEELGWPHGTVSGRLARARALLRDRLGRRGLALPAALLLAALPSAAASAAVPPVLLTSTLKAASAYAAGSLAAGVITTQVATLTQGALHTMLIAKLKVVIALVAAVGLLTTGLGVAGYYAWANDAGTVPAVTASAATSSGSPSRVLTGQAKSDVEALVGEWHVVQAERSGRKPDETEAEFVRSMRFIFTKDTVTLSMAGENKKLSYKLDTEKSPRQIEITPEDKKETGRGIYALEGDTLKLCVSEDMSNPAAPADFSTTQNDGRMLLVLKRGQAPKLPPGTEDKVKEARNRLISQNNLKQMALAFHNYHDTFGKFPAGATFGADGKPLLSWRVAILPFIEQDALYKAFKMDEPWDSEHNKKLIAQMPKVYELPGKASKEKGQTFYRVFTGKDTLFDGNQGTHLAKITDGTSNTILAVEAADPVIWTKPDDLAFDANKPLPKLGGYFSNGFHVAFCDGSVRMVGQNVDEKVLRLFILPNDGQVVNHDDLTPKKK